MTTSIASVPAARSLEHFSATRVGDEVVLYDDSTMAYHTLNAPAFAVWQLCDGVRDIDTIVDAMKRSGNAATPETVELAIAELGEAGLLVSEAERWNSGLTRRRVVKLAAAGALGAGVLPAVSSVTAPTSAQVVSCPTCGGLPTGLQNGQPCEHGCQCQSGNCRINPGQGGTDIRCDTNCHPTTGCTSFCP